MSKKERAFRMMKDGVELSVIREELGSGSAFYEGLRLYGKWMSDIIDGLESEVKLHEGELETRRNLLEVLSSEIEIAEKKNEGLRAVFDDRSAEMEHLGSTYSEKKDKLDGVISDLVSLRGRGLTEDVIAKVGKIDFVSEDDLLDRISTLQAFQVLKSELKKVDVEIQDSRSALARDDARLKVIRDEIVSQSNALDEIKRKKWMFNQSNLVVQGFLQEGYNTELLLSILEALEGLSIKGQPNTSIQRLVTGLNGYQSLEELQRACREDQDELFRIRKELTETRATLRVYKDNILSVIEEAQVRSISVFEEQGKKLGAKVEQDLGVIKNKQIADYEKVGKIAMDQLIKLHNTGVREIQNASRDLKNALNQYEQTVRQWGDQKQELGKLQEIMDYAEIIHGALESPRSLKDLPVYVIERLAFAITNWIHHNAPDATMRPDDGIHSLDRNLDTYSDYNILALSDMISKYMALQAFRVN